MTTLRIINQIFTYLPITVGQICTLVWIYDLKSKSLPDSNTFNYLSIIENRHNHGLWTPNEAFFHWNYNFWWLSRQFGQIHFGAFGVFSADLSAPILVLWVPCPCFPLINHYFYKKPSLYIFIQNIYLVLGFEFGPQRIRDLAMVCP